MPLYQFKTALLVTTAALLVTVSAIPASAQTPPAKPPVMDHEKMGMQEPATGWKELDAFHTLMAASWHPASGKNDLAPAKAKAVEMAAAARKWEASVAPKGCDTPKLKEAVIKVSASSQEFAAMVAKAQDDAALKTKLGAIHETFETVEQGCKPKK